MAKRELTWSKEDLELLRQLSPKNLPINEIADQLHRSPNAVKLTAKRYGIQLCQLHRNWKNDEKEYLKRNWGKQPLWYISSILHRDEHAIAQQAHKMKLDALWKSSEDIGLMEFVRGTGIKRERIIKTLAPKYGFPLKKKRNGEKQGYYFVDFDAVLPWMEQHQDLYDGSKIQDGFFVEPDWLKEKKRRDISDNTYLSYYVRRRPWTERDISNLKYMAKKGLGPTKIAKELDRSMGAVIAKMWTVQM